MNKYQRLTINERELIGQYLSQGKSLRYIALCLNCQVSTISREVKHFTNSGTPYKAWLSQHFAEYLSPEGMIHAGLLQHQNFIALLLRS